MKTAKLATVFAVVCCHLSAFAQVAQDAVADPTQEAIKGDGTPKPAVSEPVVVDQGPHHRTWRRTVSEQLPDGTIVQRESSYIQIGTGMNAFRDGAWVPAEDVLEIGPDAVVGDKGQHLVRLPLNINTLGGIEFTKEDKHFKSHVVGLAFTDAASGQSVLIAEIQDSKAEQLTKNSILYRSAFRGPFQADLRYTYTLAGLEQDVIIRENVPSPAAYNLPEESTRLEIFSEFIESPEPVKQLAVLSGEADPARRQQMVDPDLTDEQLAWNEVVMGTGSAFPLSSSDTANGVPVGKSWVTINDPEQGKDRRFLIEKVDYTTVKAHLEQLPQAAPAPQEKLGAGLKTRRDVLMAAATPGTNKRRGGQRAAIPALLPPDRGYVIDYSLIVSQTNFTFRPDSTYYVSNNTSVYLSSLTTLEPGAVIKSAPTASKIQLLGPLDCRTSTYKPAYFIASDDNSAGEPISGSTGNPGTNVYSSSALEFNAASTTFDLHDVRIRNARFGLVVGNGTLICSHSQVGLCQYMLHQSTTGYTVKFRNVLGYNIRRAMMSSPSGSICSWENVTLHRVDTLRETTTTTFNLTNCLLISVTNALVYTGINNVSSLSDTGFFQTLGAGGRYLANGSSYRSGGSPNIDPTLASALKQMTVDPPVVITTNFAVTTTLKPYVARDTNSNPAYGYHYGVLDYCVSALTVTGATLTLSNGIAIGVYGGTGFSLQSGSSLVSRGRPECMNVLTPYYVVQESQTSWGGTLVSLFGQAAVSMTTYPIVDFRFTELPLVRQSASQPYIYWSGSSGPTSLALRDCSILGGYLNLIPSGGGTPYMMTLGITNNIIDGAKWILYQGSANSGMPMPLQFRNNLVRNGYLELDMSRRNAEWFVHDNFFDTNDLRVLLMPITNSHNGYRNTMPIGTTWGYNKTNSAVDYQTGPLGRFYFPTNGGAGGLTSLVNAGSRSAAAAGLYHTTTATNQTKEAASTVDIGFHYVALNGAGQPVDYDGDGIPDYVEDKSGDGKYQVGETRWYPLPTGRVIIFDGQPLQYFPGAGSLPLDPIVTVADNDPLYDDNFTNLVSLTFSAAPGDVVNLLAATVGAIQITIGAAGQVYFQPGNIQIATMSGGDGVVPLSFSLLLCRTGPSWSQRRGSASLTQGLAIHFGSGGHSSARLADGDGHSQGQLQRFHKRFPANPG